MSINGLTLNCITNYIKIATQSFFRLNQTDGAKQWKFLLVITSSDSTGSLRINKYKRN